MVAAGLCVPQLADTVEGMHMSSWVDTFPKQAVVSSAGAWGHVTGTWLLTAGCAAVEEHKYTGLELRCSWK